MAMLFWSLTFWSLGFVSDLELRISDFLQSSAFSGNASIKITKLCKTKPIFETPKMNPTNYMTKAYDNNSPLLKVQKRSQNEPNQTQFYSYPVWRACPLEFIRLRRNRVSGIRHRESSSHFCLFPFPFLLPFSPLHDKSCYPV